MQILYPSLHTSARQQSLTGVININVAYGKGYKINKKENGWKPMSNL